MSRADLQSDRVDELYLVLVEIEHAVLPEPIRVVLDNADLTALGKNWKKGQLTIRLPNQIEGERSAEISVANVDRQIGNAARQMITPATVRIKIVARDAPDTIEVDFPPMHIANASGNVGMVTGELVSVIDPAAPARNARATKDTAPAAYR